MILIHLQTWARFGAGDQVDVEEAVHDQDRAAVVGQGQDHDAEIHRVAAAQYPAAPGDPFRAGLHA